MRWWHAPWSFAVHAVVGSLIFAVIAGAAIALDFFVTALEGWRVSSFILWGLRAAEYVLFLTDLVLFLTFIWRTARRTLREL